MTRVYFGRFSALELLLGILTVGVFAAAMIWVFFGNSENTGWRWLMTGSLALAVVGRFLHLRRLRREYREAQAAAEKAKKSPARNPRKRR